MNDFTKQFIVVCWAILVIYMFVSAFRVKRTIERQSNQWRVWAIAIVAAIVALRRIGVTGWISGAVLWKRTMATETVADFCTLFGLLIVLWARTTLGGNWSAFVVFKENHDLIERGPYRYMRHPMYSGILIMVLGLAIFYGILGIFALFAIYFVGVFFKASREEMLMTKHFPKAYPDYKKRVKMLIPYVF
jgi:protein-S-isoprenylcysteine O-methyltransferase